MFQKLQQVCIQMGQILSILLGFGLAGIFRKTCKAQDVFLFMTKPSDVEEKIYSWW